MLSLNADHPVQELPNDTETKAKNLTIDSTYLSCTYFALMKENKKKFKLTEAD
jgi:hypothetical protein